MADQRTSRLLNPRLPVLWHGADYNPEQWPSEVWDEDVRLMKEARCNVATIGIFSWVRLEPEEDRFEFDWLDEVIEKLSKGGRHFILATPSAAPPAWLSRKYPETLRVGPDRVRRLHGNRVNYNVASLFYRRKCRDMASRLAERYGDHPNLLAWHLSNEYNGEDYGPESIEQFRQWLRAKFDGDLGALNAAYWTSFWGHTYGSWEEIDAPGPPYGEASIQGLLVDWKRFVTDQTIDFMNNEAAPLRELSPQVPITTNLMGTYPGLDYRKLAPHLDFVSWDSYPAFEQPLTDPRTWIVAAFKHDLMRSLLPDRPWLLMESTPSSSNWYDFMTLKRPGMHRFDGLQTVAHGSDGVLYFQWRQSRGCQEQLHGGIVGHAGDENTRVFKDVRDQGIELEALSGVAGTLLRSEVAVVFDWDARWSVDAACGPTQRNKKYEETCIDHYEAFWQAGIGCDVIGLNDDFSRYKVVVAPMAYALPPRFAERLAAFVSDGGTFLTTYLSGWVDENSLVFEGGFLAPLRQVLGVWSEELDALPPGGGNEIEVLEPYDWGIRGSYGARDFCELIHCESAKVLAVYKNDFYAERPAVTVNRYGKGLALYVASRNEAAFLRALLPRLAQRAGVKPAIDATLPEGVTAQVRVGPDRDTVFILNASGRTVEVKTSEWGVVRLGPYDVSVQVRERVGAGAIP